MDQPSMVQLRYTDGMGAQEWTSPPWYSSGTQMVWEPRNGPALHGTAQVHRWYGSPGMDQPSMVQLRYTDGVGAREWTSPPWYSSGTQMVREPRNGPALHGTAQVHRWYGSPGMDQPSMVQLRYTDGMGAQEWTSPPWYSSGTHMTSPPMVL